MGGRAAPIEPRSVGDVSDQLREQLALGVGADRLGGRREIDLPTREQQDQSSQLVEDRRVLDRRRNEITQAAELNTLVIKEVIYSIVGRFQQVAVDAQWRRMRGRDAEKQTDRHGQSSQKVFESHIAPHFGFGESPQRWFSILSRSTGTKGRKRRSLRSTFYTRSQSNCDVIFALGGIFT